MLSIWAFLVTSLPFIVWNTKNLIRKCNQNHLINNTDIELYFFQYTNLIIVKNIFNEVFLQKNRFVYNVEKFAFWLNKWKTIIHIMYIKSKSNITKTFHNTPKDLSLCQAQKPFRQFSVLQTLHDTKPSSHLISLVPPPLAPTRMYLEKLSSRNKSRAVDDDDDVAGEVRFWASARGSGTVWKVRRLLWPGKVLSADPPPICPLYGRRWLYNRNKGGGVHGRLCQRNWAGAE